MKSLMRLTKQNRNSTNASKEKNATESGLSCTEAKNLQKTKQQLLGEKENVSSNGVNGKTDKLNGHNGKNVDTTINPLSNDIIDIDFINKKLPKELLIRIFSYLDIVSLCRSACVSKYWNSLALDGSNWQYVDLFNFQTDVSGHVVENLAKRCNEFLKAIRLENCRWINDDSIKILFQTCKNIEILNLKQCIKLTDNSFIELECSFLANLANINLESCFISDRSILSISRCCQNLESIDLSWCKNITSDALIKLVESCPKLKYFSSRGIANMNDEVLIKISVNCSKLIHLNINNCDNVSDNGLIAIANQCSLIKFLGVSNCSQNRNLTDGFLQSLGKNCNDLTILEVSCCSNLSDNGFMAISKGCHKIERIDMEECTRITDQTIVNLSAYCSNLRHLTLSRCESITDDGIQQLSISSCATINESLQVLELDNCPLISDISLKQLYNCKSLVQLELYDCQLITRSGIKKFQKNLPDCKVHAYFAPPITASSQRPRRSCSCKCCNIL